MAIRPRFRPRFHVEVIPDEGVFASSEQGGFVLTDELEILLAPLLDGQRTLDELVSTLQGRLEPMQVVRALMSMRHRGLLVDAGFDGRSEQSVFLDLLEDDTAAATERLGAAVVSLRSFGQLDPNPLISALQGLGLRVALDSEDGVRMVLTDDYLRAELDQLNANALDDQRPWLLVAVGGRGIGLGPLFVPQRTGCWRCLADRQRGLRNVGVYVQARTGRSAPVAPPAATLPTTLALALNLAATEVYKWIATGQADHLEGQVRTLDMISLDWQTHRLVRRPQCTACGVQKHPRAATELILESRKKVFTADGGHRCATPERTFERLAHHISPVTGIVASIHEAYSVNLAGAPVRNYIARYATASLGHDLRTMQDALYRRAGGKGRTAAQAKMSALGESIERYAGIFQGDEPRICASLDHLGEQAIHLHACTNYSDAQFAAREHSNRSSSNSTWIAAPFDPSAEIEWSPLWSLTHGRTRYLPTAYCYYGYAEHHRLEFARANSNGCSAGGNLEEAILQGFMELIERDGVALWWYNRLSRRAVELESFDEPYIGQLREFYRSIHRELWVLDLTSDLDIPIFAAVSRRTDKPAEDLIVGFGAHLDPRAAFLRALTELNQSLPPVADVDAEGQGYVGVNYRAIRWWKTATIANQPYLVPAQSRAPRVCSDYRDQSSDDLREDISTCVQRVRARGMEMLILDQSRADVELAVVKVVVPGLRHFWPRFGPGRLYDVPVAMGELSAPRDERELNPHDVYF